MGQDEEDELLRSVAVQNVHSSIAARRRAEQDLIATRDALAARERELSLIYRNVSDAVFFLAVESGEVFRFVSVNPAFLTATGLSQEQVIGKLVPDLIPEPSCSLALEHYRRAIREKTTIRWEETAQYPSGKKVGAVCVTPVFDTRGTCNNLIGTVHDITERIQAEERERAARGEAESANRTKDEFLTTLSHELRTPLAAMLGWSYILRRKNVSEADFQQGLEAIERNGRVQTQLIDDLLDVSRITSGKMRLDMQAVDPISFINAAVETVRPAATAKGVKLETALEPSAAAVFGDAARLQQVVWNLLSNAIKFTPKDGRVRVNLERLDSEVLIKVTDTGIGIEQDFLPHVFERFRQADSSATRKFGGLGLGLSIVKHLVELHGGTVQVDSPGEDRGASFEVRLPIGTVRSPRHARPESHAAAPRVAAADCNAADLTGVKVVIVDDEADARDLVKRVLVDCGAEVLTATKATEALALVERERPHVLVSDIGMPEVDGFELLRRVRALGPSRGGNVPAIALTAFARSEDRARALQAGFLVHMSKPVEAAQLVATVATVAGK